MLAVALPASAARPLLDRHQWDAYFALFARDADVPWKPATVRLDTYSGAAVDFAAYDVDPADVIVAGANRAPRAVDVTRRRPVVRWRFTPPAGYHFQSNDVPVPLGGREGFFVIEARRGDAVQQVWINRTHVGLVTREAPEGLTVWTVDLRSGRPLAGINVAFLVGASLVDRKTDARGLIVWTGARRPAFALADDRNGRAFVSLLPQAPVPPAIVGVRVESAVARAGTVTRFVGFARRRGRDGYRPATGDARVTLAERGTTIASSVVHLDAAGAFAGELAVPPSADAGDYALLAAVGGAVGGTTEHVDAASDVALAIEAPCPCDPTRDVPVAVAATRGGAPAAGVAVRLNVVRTPHIVPPGASEDGARWGTTAVLDATELTGPDGRAHFTLPSPTDGLDSTYGIRASARGASATSRVVVANAPIALALEPDAPVADTGAPIGFTVRAFDPADGSPAGARNVVVRLTHGASAQERNVDLDAAGHGRVTFPSADLGSNLALAQATVDGRTALDMSAVLVEPRALSGAGASASSGVVLSLDRARYAKGDAIAVHAATAGAAGSALFALDGARAYATRIAPVAAGSAQATLTLPDTVGAVAASVAVVRDGAIAVASVPVRVDAPGHARETELALDKPAYAPGATMHVTVRDGGGSSAATVAVRIADARESGPALFDDAPDVLAAAATTERTPSTADPGWHAYALPARSKASDLFAADRARKVATEVPSIGAAAPRTLYWNVARAAGDGVDVPAPATPGRFVVSIMKISDDGDVGAASAAFVVQ